MLMNQSAAIAPYEESEGEYNAPVTSILGKLLTTYIGRTEPEDTDDFLSYGSFTVERCDSEVTVTRQLSPWNWWPRSLALQQATQDIHTSGAPVINAFANSAWRLLIASRTIELPKVLAGESFEFVQQEQLIVSVARLYAQPAQSKDTSLHALSVWRAVVPIKDREATSSFLSTVVQLSDRTTRARSKKLH